MTGRPLAAVLLVLCCVAVQAQSMQLEVVPLKHRTTDEIIPIIRPLLAPGGTVSGMNNQLIVKTTPANLREIMQVLDSIDLAARRLLITVTQDISGTGRDISGSLDARYSSGDLSAETSGRHGPRDGGAITYTDEDGNAVRLRGRDRRTQADDRNAYSVQTIEGQAAFIQAGHSIPLPAQTAYVTPDGVVVQETTEYHDATSGFYVLPRLSGDRVTLLVSPNMTRVRSEHGRPVFDVQNVETTASGRLGEWISLGGVDHQSSRTSGDILSQRTRSSFEQRSLFIKVEEIP